jgi:hypothetical protein
VKRSIFRSAITDEHGDVDAGYLGLYVVIVIILGSIPAAIVLATIRMFILPDHPLDLVGIGAVIAGAGAAFGTAAAGVGLFRAGDKPRAGTETQTITATSTTSTPAPAAP